MPRLTKARKELLNTMMKDVIFEAASAVLQENGPNGLTMERVAKAAGVSRSSLYDYFQNKDEVFQFLAKRISEPTLRAVAEIVEGDLPAAEKLAAVYRTALTSIGKHQAIFTMLARDEVARKEVDSYKKNIRSSNTVLGLLSRVFEQGIAEGKFRRANPVLLARMFVGSGSVLMDMELDRGECDKAEQIEQHVKLQVGVFLRGISTDDGKDAFE